MTAVYVDALGVARTWINSRTSTLVGIGKPLQKGAHLSELQGAADTCYALLTLLPSTTAAGGAESPQMYARLSARIYGPSLEAISKAAVALADELITQLAGHHTVVTLPAGEQVEILVVDDITGPYDQPDQNLPTQLVDFTMLMQPYVA